METLRLTQTVQKGGCAAKVAALELRQILKQVQFPVPPPELHVDSSTFDDAAIYELNEQQSLVQTLDFFTPIVDTPYRFGRIAAANALSDVYAMGGRPITAMAIFAFPLAQLDRQVAVDVLQGAVDAVKESGAALAGGHTIDDDTMKFGLSVTGLVHPAAVWSNAGAKAGDVLILTKPLGTGASTAGLKRGEVSEADIADVMASMEKLNNVPTLLSAEECQSVHAATDITGFGLIGHGMHIAEGSQVDLRFQYQRLPHFSRVFEFLEKGHLTKAHRTNLEYAGQACDLSILPPLWSLLVRDPQTSGGLLLAVDPQKATGILEKIRREFPFATVVGQVLPQGKSHPRLEFV